MKVERLISGRFEAITNVKDAYVETVSGVIPVEFIGYGDTAKEAIRNCLNKVDKFLHPLKNGGSSNPIGNLPVGFKEDF